MRTKILIAMMTAGMFSFGAIAQEPPPQEPPQERQPPAQQQQTPTFDELDVDGSGYISRQEAGALPCLAQNFDRIDPESDEGLDRREFEDAVSQHCH